MKLASSSTRIPPRAYPFPFADTFGDYRGLRGARRGHGARSPGRCDTADPTVDAVVQLFEAHHDRLRKAVDGLDVAALDRVLAPETNSIAILVTHATGSVLGWLHIAAGRPLARDRDAEFRVRELGPADLRRRIDAVATAVPDLVRAAVEGGLGTVRRIREGHEVTTAYAVAHALEHLAEHVGHVELTRQLVSKR